METNKKYLAVFRIKYLHQISFTAQPILYSYILLLFLRYFVILAAEKPELILTYKIINHYANY